MEKVYFLEIWEGLRGPLFTRYEVPRYSYAVMTAVAFSIAMKEKTNGLHKPHFCIAWEYVK